MVGFALLGRKLVSSGVKLIRTSWDSRFTGILGFVGIPGTLEEREIVKGGFWERLPVFYHFCGAPSLLCKIE